MPVPSNLAPDALQSYQDAMDAMSRVAGSFNLFSLLATHFPGIPSLMSGREGLWTAASVADPWTALGLFLLLPTVGIGLASLYYVSVGRQVVGRSEGIGPSWRRVWKTWVRLLGFVLLLSGVLLLAGLPVTAAVLFFGAANSSVLDFLAAFVWVTALWVQFYLFFVVDAMVVSDVGPLQAIRNSVAVVKFHLGSTMGLIVLIWIVTLGMPIVWESIAQSTAGIVVGILGNAYIATGLTAASMTYYRDRFRGIGDMGQGRGVRS